MLVRLTTISHAADAFGDDTSAVVNRIIHSFKTPSSWLQSPGHPHSSVACASFRLVRLERVAQHVCTSCAVQHSGRSCLHRDAATASHAALRLEISRSCQPGKTAHGLMYTVCSGCGNLHCFATEPPCLLTAGMSQRQLTFLPRLGRFRMP